MDTFGIYIYICVCVCVFTLPWLVDVVVLEEVVAALVVIQVLVSLQTTPSVFLLYTSVAVNDLHR